MAEAREPIGPDADPAPGTELERRRPGTAARLGFWLLMLYGLGLIILVVEYILSHIALQF
jgi:hypothetical protein